MRHRVLGAVLTVFAIVGMTGPSAAKRPSLTLATWNIAWLNAADDTGPRPRTPADYERLARYFRALDADVVALQEVDGPEAARRLGGEAYSYHFGPGSGAQRVGFAVRRGLAAEPLEHLMALDVGGLRVGVQLRVRTPRGPLRLLAVHLKAGCRNGRLGPDGSKACRKLARQQKVLERWLAAQPKDEAIVILGDFNRFYGADDAFWTGLWTPGRSHRVHSPPAGSRCWRFDRPIDHIVSIGAATRWFRPVSRWRMYADSDKGRRKTLSDHCPLIVELAP